VVLKQKSRVPITRIKHDFDLPCLLQIWSYLVNVQKTSPILTLNLNIKKKVPPSSIGQKFPWSSEILADEKSLPQRRRLAAQNVWLARRDAVLPPGKDTEPKLDHFEFTRGKKMFKKKAVRNDLKTNRLIYTIEIQLHHNYMTS